MRKLAVLSAICIGLFASRGPAAPALSDKPVKYEYAELRYARGFAGGQMGAVVKIVGAGGVVGAPAPVPPAPIGGGGPMPAAPQTTVSWTTAEEEMSFKEWEELADKLGAASPKKESPAAVHRLRVFNKLSALGWELLDRPHPDTLNGVWTFRRPVP